MGFIMVFHKCIIMYFDHLQSLIIPSCLSFLCPSLLFSQVLLLWSCLSLFFPYILLLLMNTCKYKNTARWDHLVLLTWADHLSLGKQLRKLSPGKDYFLLLLVIRCLSFFTCTDMCSVWQLCRSCLDYHIVDIFIDTTPMFYLEDSLLGTILVFQVSLPRYFLSLQQGIGL